MIRLQGITKSFAGKDGPVAALDGIDLTIAKGEIDLSAAVASLDGSRILRHRESGRDPEALARVVAQLLLDAGAADLVASASPSVTASPVRKSESS